MKCFVGKVGESSLSCFIYGNHRTIRKSGFVIDCRKCLGLLLMQERNILVFKISVNVPESRKM